LNSRRHGRRKESAKGAKYESQITQLTVELW